MPNSVAFLTPRSISNKEEDTGCKGEAELQICTVSTSLYSERNLTGLYIAFQPSSLLLFSFLYKFHVFLTLPFTNFFQLEPDSNCNYNDFIFHKKYNLLFSTIKRTELSSFLHSFSFINSHSCRYFFAILLAGIPFFHPSSCYLNSLWKHLFLPLSVSTKLSSHYPHFLFLLFRMHMQKSINTYSKLTMPPTIKFGFPDLFLVA